VGSLSWIKRQHGNNRQIKPQFEASSLNDRNRRSVILARTGAEPRMAGATETYRMAIASLEVLHPLQRAVAELGSHRISTDCLGMAGTAETIEAIRSGVSRDDARALAPLLDVVALPFAAPLAIYMTARNWLTEMKDQSRQHPVLADDDSQLGGCWLSPKFRQNLLDRMLAGEVMLLAGPLTAEQLTVGTRVLLRHSNHHVQSHTFVRPRVP
jgi:hypothetical protein